MPGYDARASIIKRANEKRGWVKAAAKIPITTQNQKPCLHNSGCSMSTHFEMCSDNYCLSALQTNEVALNAKGTGHQELLITFIKGLKFQMPIKHDLADKCCYTSVKNSHMCNEKIFI